MASLCLVLRQTISMLFVMFLFIPFRFALLECSLRLRCVCVLVLLYWNPDDLACFWTLPGLHTNWLSFYEFIQHWHSTTWTPISCDLVAHVYSLDRQLGFLSGLLTILTSLRLRGDPTCGDTAVMECISCKTVLVEEMFHYNTSHFDIDLQTILTRNLGSEIGDNANLCDACFSSLTSQLSAGSKTHADCHCIKCKRSIINHRSHTLPLGPERDIIFAAISPELIRPTNRVCYRCWIAANRAAQRERALPCQMCIWCERSMEQKRSYPLRDGPVKDLIAARIAPRQIEIGCRVCAACFEAAKKTIKRASAQDLNRAQLSTTEDDTQYQSFLAEDDCQPSTSQQQQLSTAYQPNDSTDTLCVCCQRSLAGRRTHLLPDGSVRDTIAAQIAPRQIESCSKVCYACWVAVCRNIASEEARQDNQDRLLGNIKLPNYKRTANTSHKCFVHGCTNGERMIVPSYLKRKLLKEYKLYITESARICKQHIETYDWEFIKTNFFFYINDFTPFQIETTINFALENDEDTQVNFENIDNMSDEMCHYWTGVSKYNFQRILDQTPSLQERHKNYKTALAIYLIKLRTGEPHERVGQLFNLGKAAISYILKSIRNILHEEFVPLHMGVGHLSRDDITQHNLIIPDGLFGGEERGIDGEVRGRRAIVICDGTYVYLQKSSNYYFQKKSYSLHKYRNLVKPFLIVTTDGYILDIYGPYAATVSDATIMSQLFSNEMNELRQYFREGDVFILDRGFRDSMDMMRNLNYNVHAPESLEEGETQLPALRANKSRLVTMCRWVVEAVNGYFKTDFKLLRYEFSNNAATHLMMDFRIGGAIINAFHAPITDRPDASLILERALQKLYEDNILSEIIIENNINRIRAIFTNIDAEQILLDEFPVLSESDMILFALGTYQIKQARSYYGEHIRENGTFVIEVCHETEPLQIPVLDGKLLLRGRIKSRHRSGKVYYTYIVLNTQEDYWEHRIHSYYCTCVIGKRTVGCCAHIMTIVWYMGWARHQPTAIQAPASCLDDILVREDIENEE